MQRRRFAAKLISMEETEVAYPSTQSFSATD
jgi:hypothetical protein